MMLSSFNNIPIFFNKTGSGPAVLLLHGFGDDHTVWQKTRWVDELQKSFTVISMDIRGCGKSGKPDSPNDYTLEAHCSDIKNVLIECDTPSPIMWGWSLGATIALHYSKKHKVSATIAAGTYFGPIFTDEFIMNGLAQTKDKITRARLNGLKTWEVVQPEEISTPLLVYTGTNDENVAVQLRKQKNAIETSGGQLCILQNLNHEELLTNMDAVKPLVWPFLRKNSPVKNPLFSDSQ
ncbi:MAG: alpha/beta fold hydrolase [Spirochaetales bacterium]|nr:alpha/beta fold hydrolase [Spirochaetales bacterium]